MLLFKVKAAVKRFGRLFTKNTGLRKVVKQYMGADACPVPEGEGSWLFYFLREADDRSPGERQL